MVQPQQSREYQRFLAEWAEDSPCFDLQTSGSTGKPKLIRVSKSQMIASAKMTCAYLNIKNGATALLCMSPQYIAGRMMMVRAMVANLRLIEVEPSGNPLQELSEAIDFAAMTPMQVYNTLQSEKQSERLKNIGTLLIGGSAIDDKLAAALQHFPNPIYSTYGMTETVSHIALRRINGKEASKSYTPLPGVNISLSKSDTLVIDAPLLCSEKLVTNDCVDILADGTFIITGRIDNVINSGGIKLQIEEIEKKLRQNNAFPLAITSIDDEKFGQAVTLLIEGSSNFSPDLSSLSKYELPKHVIYLQQIPLTQTGKTDRLACRNIATSACK